MRKGKKVVAISSAVLMGVTSVVTPVSAEVFANEIKDTTLEQKLSEEKENKSKDTIEENIEKTINENAKENIKDKEISQKASINVQNIVNQTKDVLKAISYKVDNKALFDLISKSYFSMPEKTNKRLEISKREGKPIYQISEQQVIKELNEEIFNYGYYKDTFLKVQNDIETILPHLINNSTTGQENPQNEEKLIVDKINNNKEKLLLGLTYIYRLYDFNMGDKNLKDILISNPDFYGKKFNSLDWFIRLGSIGGDMLSEGNNLNVFNRYFAGQITNSRSLVEFLQENKNKLIPNKSLDQWFKETSKATIEEVASKQNPNAIYRAYSKLVSDEKMQSHILPLLTVSENSVYLITNSATLTYGVVDTYVDRNLKQSNPELYKQKVNEFKNKVAEIAKNQGDFIDLWYRIAKPEVRNKLQSNRIVIDSFLLYSNGGTSSEKDWSAKLGPNASLGVNEFMTPMGMYAPYPGRLDAQAEGNGVRYFLVKALSDRGPSTYTHELTHLLEDIVWMNQNVRDGIQAEVYPRGLFETYEKLDEPIFNLNLTYDKTGKDRFYNATPERFQTDKDLKEYMNGVLDVVYTLDYAEANTVLKRSDADKLKWYHKFEQEVDTKNRHNHGDPKSTHNIDTIRELKQEEVGKLKTVNDLIDNDIVVSRYEIEGLKITGKAQSNGYYVVPLFTTNYSAVQNNNGVSGDITIRKYAHELLGEYGYYEGLVPFLSNQYKKDAEAENKILSDEYILGKIFKGEYKTMADFKKAMFKRRIDKKDNLKPITINWQGRNVTIDKFETIEKLMQEAVEKDLKEVVTNQYGWNNMRSYQTSVERLKAQIYKVYLNQTNEFRNSIYKDVTPPTKTYIVHFEKGADDVQGTMQDQTFEYGKAQKLSKNTFTRVGYTFKGWEANGTTYTDEQSVENLVTEANGSIILTAKWEKIQSKTYTVHFEKGADDVQGTMKDQTFEYGKAQKLSKNTFTRVGYTFKGWEANGTTYTDEQSVQDLVSQANGSITLTAKWEKIQSKTYTVHFEKGADDVQGTMKDQTFEYGKAQKLSKNTFTRVGYTFKGWEANGKTYTDEQSVQDLVSQANGSIILTAKWEANSYTVKFNKGADDVQGEMQDQTFEYGKSQKLSKNKFTRAGYTFKGWEANGKTYTDEQSVQDLVSQANGSITLTAKWEANSYIVKFNKGANDVQGEMQDQTFEYGKAQKLSKNTFTRVGYTFKGWEANDKTYTDEQSVQDLVSQANGSITLTAKWEANSYTVKFNKGADDVQGTMQDQIFKYGEAQKLSKNTFTRVGYTFKGWEANGTTYTDEQSVQDLVSQANGSIILTAKWEKTLEVINSAPTIKVEDKELTVGDEFNPLDEVIATDNEDGEIKLTDKNIIENNVDINKAGVYSITYKVTDKLGASFTKTIKVTVKDKPVNPDNKPKPDNKSNQDKKPNSDNKPNNTSSSRVPTTSDLSNVGLLGSLFALSSGVLTSLLSKKRKKKQ